jgi:putative membrane protein
MFSRSLFFPPHTFKVKALLAAAVSALSLAAMPVHSQGTGVGAGGFGSLQATDPDKKLLDGLAEASIAGIESGKTALEKSGSPEVKKFAQQVVDERSAALREVERLALIKGMNVPKDADMQHKASGTALKLLAGDTFDKQYLSNAGVEDHAQTVALLHKTQREARDPEIKALAARLLPPTQQQLETAKQMAARKK